MFNLGISDALPIFVPAANEISQAHQLRFSIGPKMGITRMSKVLEGLLVMVLSITLRKYLALS
jgi:hypothetical protein